MPPIRSRPLAAIDYAILLLALVLGAMTARWCDHGSWGVISTGTAYQRPRFEKVHLAGLLVAAALTLGALLVLARDQTSWSRSGMSRLGVMTVGVATLLICGGVLDVWLRTRSMVPSRTMLQLVSFYFTGALLSNVSGAILGSWILFALSGLWRPARDGRDRLGRLVGLCWLLFGGLVIVKPLLLG